MEWGGNGIYFVVTKFIGQASFPENGSNVVQTTNDSNKPRRG